ncbi:MAG: hypothetical protein WAV92_05170 [Halopseudomonas yangmingensis]
MLFKEKLLLSNCDSVRGLSPEEWRKRFLTGLAFADGVVLSPNTLIDNLDVTQSLAQTNVHKYLNEEGAGKLVIRGFNMGGKPDMQEYYQRLPDNFIISSLPGSPCKGQLSGHQQKLMEQRLQHLQGCLDSICAVSQSLVLGSDGLSREVLRRLDEPASIGHSFDSDGERTLFMLGASNCRSRSDWYAYARQFFANRGQPQGFEQLCAEVIDPAYNSLYAMPSEGFLQDNIRHLQGLPEQLLDVGIAFRALRREIALIQYPLRLFEFISSAGAGELARYLTDEAMNFIEDKLVDSGHDYMTRRNWFGMYPRLRRYMGLEIK